MGSPRFLWAVTAAVVPLVAAPAGLAQSRSNGSGPSNLDRNGPPSSNVIDSAPQKPSRRGRSRTAQTQRDSPQAANDWNPHYLKGKAQFIQGQYDEALTELEQNLADCDRIDFESMRRDNEYFDHISTSIPGMGQSPHEFIRASNLQWVGAVLAAQGRYDPAEMRYGQMANYAEQCWPGRLSTFEGCACQGLAFLLAARGRYAAAAERYRLALAQIEGNQVQIGLPPAPCVAMILVALADVELARGRARAAEQCIRRAEHVQEAQHQLGIGPAPLDRAALLTVFAQLRHYQSLDSEAHDFYAQALDLIRNIRKEHPLAAYCLEGLGEIDLAHGRLEQSEEHFRESLAVRKSALGEGHREVAFSLDGLARVAAAQGKEAEAESFSKDASVILTRALGPTHPDVMAVAEHLKRHDQQPREIENAVHPHARFLAIPTFLTVGWQVLHLGKDWRIVEGNIRRREAKEDKAAHRAALSAQAAASGRKGQ
jgi:tetratricopeptide (TPR) repeat protein